MAEKTVIVTGGGRGIGSAIVKAFSSAGYKVVVLDIVDSNLCEDLRKGGYQCDYILCDVSSEDHVRSAIDHIEKRYGRVDVLVNNAAILIIKPIEETSWDDFRRIVDINIGGMFLITKYVVPIMKRQGKGVIINIASAAVYKALPNHSLYSATKGAIISMTKALAWELGKYGIRVVSISPSSVDTDMLRKEAEHAGIEYEEFKTQRSRSTALDRVASPEEIARVVLFIASENASFITGVDILVDGGRVAS